MSTPYSQIQEVTLGHEAGENIAVDTAWHWKASTEGEVGATTS
jgi:hypothetical protein